MTSLQYYFGFLTILSAVAADFEYDTGIDKDKADQLLCDLIHPTAKVLFRRSRTSDGIGRHFRVDTRRDTTNTHRGAYRKPADIPGEEGRTDYCDGRPGIQTILKADFFRGWENDPSANRKIFCLDEMHIDIPRDRKGKPYVTLTVTFKNHADKRNIGIIVHPFKPSIKQDNPPKDKHVPHIPPPSPIQSVILDTDGSKMFISDISWMTEILKIAKIQRSENDASGKYTEYYLAGPVILPPSSFQKILDL